MTLDEEKDRYPRGGNHPFEEQAFIALEVDGGSTIVIEERKKKKKKELRRSDGSRNDK